MIIIINIFGNTQTLSCIIFNKKVPSHTKNFASSFAFKLYRQAWTYSNFETDFRKNVSRVTELKNSI